MNRVRDEGLKPGHTRQLFETVALGPPENAIGFVLWRLMHRYQREADRALRPLDLTHMQFMALIMVAWLVRSEQKVRQNEVARQAAIHPMQVSQVLKTLERKGLIQRRVDPADVRAKLVMITADGIQVLGNALPLVIEVQRELFGEEGRPDGYLLAKLLSLDRGGSQF